MEKKLILRILSKQKKMKEEERLRNVDYKILLFLLAYLDEDNYRDIKKNRISELLEVNKSTVSRTFSKLKQSGIIIEGNPENCEFGYRLNSNLVDEVIGNEE